MEYFENCREATEPYYLCWPVVYEFLRVVTHPRVFAAPLTWQHAWKAIEVLQAWSQMIMLRESDEHERTLKALLQDLGHPRGNILHDCHIAAICKENGVARIYTCDSDFRRFSFLDAVNPVE